ncbi:MAG: hypothetical protein JWQ17_4911 [Tardiphaga sp.]|nr:hypothetical protein [Tardiphaga sp.]
MPCPDRHHWIVKSVNTEACLDMFPVTDTILKKIALEKDRGLRRVRARARRADWIVKSVSDRLQGRLLLRKTAD